MGAQWLYQYLLTCSSLNYVGVADWRPGRIAGMATRMELETIIASATELEGAYFVVIDDRAEEVLIRSFLRHDGLLANPNMVKSIGKDFAGVASARLRGVVAHEMNRLLVEFPNGFGKWNIWESRGGLQTILGATQIDIRTSFHTRQPTPSDTPLGTPSHTGSERGTDTGSGTSTATSTTTEASLPSDRSSAKKPEIRLPTDWAPTAAHFERASTRRIDIAREAESFRLHADTHDRHAANWNSAFTTWLNKATPPVPTRRNPDAWMNQ
jgi:hypothetical protein